MEDKTPLYMLIIVGIVAFVGIIVLLSSGSGTPAADNTENAITGNIVGSDGGTSSNGVAKVLFTLFILGVAGYMYFRRD